jgi:hypothetical protein
MYYWEYRISDAIPNWGWPPFYLHIGSFPGEPVSITVDQL